jgi:hypothetical protein
MSEAPKDKQEGARVRKSPAPPRLTPALAKSILFELREIRREYRQIRDLLYGSREDRRKTLDEIDLETACRLANKTGDMSYVKDYVKKTVEKEKGGKDK